ncbi:esterase/lipase family protein [Nocardia sp. alder85J]|uniref:esterase/lipase family protein n=1 Tax=Nocardia sp. alder85J TaxID=2862949 RepID=UPI001CD21F2C|nr:alpha/beta fold hydrolase [Nocardia sp. alder85J]MCX4096987.1 alpha/beta fold hydrolase [Nocardia sp. alder85J]
MRRVISNFLAAQWVVALIALMWMAPAGAEPVPPGADDFSCRPAAAHPDPVVLVHGSGTDAQRSFSILAPALRGDGFCVFTANLGRAQLPGAAVSGSDAVRGWPGLGPIGAALAGRTVYGVADIAGTAVELAGFVDTVRSATGADRVALVGHSTGGTVIRQYLLAHPDAARTVVTLGTPYRGSTYAGLPDDYPDLAQLGMDGPHIAAQIFGAAGVQQTAGSPWLARLNAAGEARPGVRFTAIASRTDEVITPPDTALLTAPGPGDRDIWVQDGCPFHPVDHNGLLADPHAAALVAAALAGDAAEPPC